MVAGCYVAIDEIKIPQYVLFLLSRLYWKSTSHSLFVQNVHTLNKQTCHVIPIGRERREAKGKATVRKGQLIMAKVIKDNIVVL